MAAYNLAPIANWFSNLGSNTAGSQPGLPLSGGLLWTYAAGSSTPTPVYTTATGVAWSNPIVLSSDGRVPGSIWIASGQAMKFVLQDALGNNIPNGLIDNVYGVNDTSGIVVAEWVASGYTPAYSSTNVFTTAGNSTATFQVGRRIQATVTAGTAYGTITSSVYGVATTVTLLMDAGSALDNGLIAVNVGFLNGTHPSVPGALTYPLSATSLASSNWNADVVSGTFRNTGLTQPMFSAYRSHAAGNQTSGTLCIFDAIFAQQYGNGVTTGYIASSGTFVAPVSGLYLFVANIGIGNATAGTIFPLIEIAVTSIYPAAGATTYIPAFSNGNASVTCLAYLSAGNTADVVPGTTFTATFYMLPYNPWGSNFSGYLLA